jgi:hypothetical protein
MTTTTMRRKSTNDTQNLTKNTVNIRKKIESGERGVTVTIAPTLVLRVLIKTITTRHIQESVEGTILERKRQKKGRRRKSREGMIARAVSCRNLILLGS